jgi:hypothetical protein
MSVRVHRHKQQISTDWTWSECALWRRGARSFYRLNVTAARATESTEFREWPDGGGRTDEYEVLAGTAGERAGRVVGGEKRLRHAATVGGAAPARQFRMFAEVARSAGRGGRLLQARGDAGECSRQVGSDQLDRDLNRFATNAMRPRTLMRSLSSGPSTKPRLRGRSIPAVLDRCSAS